MHEPTTELLSHKANASSYGCGCTCAISSHCKATKPNNIIQ